MHYTFMLYFSAESFMESEKVKILKQVKSWIQTVTPHLNSVTHLNPINKLLKPQFPHLKKTGDIYPTHVFICNNSKHLAILGDHQMLAFFSQYISHTYASHKVARL